MRSTRAANRFGFRVVKARPLSSAIWSSSRSPMLMRRGGSRRCSRTWLPMAFACRVRSTHRTVTGAPARGPDGPFLRGASAVGRAVVRGDQDIAPIVAPVPVAVTIVRLQRLLAPIASRHQIVHGDLAGNPLWADGLPPAVIDFTPYWRPAGYGTALLIVDAVLWYGAEPSMLRLRTDRFGRRSTPRSSAALPAQRRRAAAERSIIGRDRGIEPHPLESRTRRAACRLARDLTVHAAARRPRRAAAR